MEWNTNPQQIADGFNVDVEEFFDSVSGTTVSALSESQVAKLLGGKRVKGSQLPYDVVVKGRKNKYIEVRNICKVNPKFSPSTATGKGRFFCQEDHDKKLDAVDSYVFCDLRDKFRTPPKFYEIPVTKVRELQECGIIKRGAMTTNQFFKTFPYEEYALRN